MKIGIKFMFKDPAMVNFSCENPIIFNWKYPELPQKYDYAELSDIIPISAYPSEETIEKYVTDNIDKKYLDLALKKLNDYTVEDKKIEEEMESLFTSYDCQGSFPCNTDDISVIKVKLESRYFDFANKHFELIKGEIIPIYFVKPD